MTTHIASSDVKAKDPTEFNFIKGVEWQNLGRPGQEKYLDDALGYWRNLGFPHITLSEKEIQTRFLWLSRCDASQVFLPNSELRVNCLALDLANYFHPQMWSVTSIHHRSPEQIFNDDRLLRTCIQQALTVWPKLRGAEGPNLRAMLRTFRHTRRVANFRPTVAKALYERYSKPGDRVLDFSAGYSGRLVACLALDRNYVGVDPCGMQIDGLQKTYDTINRLGLARSSVDLRLACAEDELSKEEDASYDLVFTSPPYFNRERYSNEPTQSYIRYPTYIAWRDQFLYRVLSESQRVLKHNGILIINIADIQGAPIASDALCFVGTSLTLRDTFFLRQSTLPFHRGAEKPKYRHEPIFVFQKV